MTYKPTISCAISLPPKFTGLMLFIFFFISMEGTAKGKFKIDKNGKCHDPEFLEMIKEREYDVISYFDTVSIHPLRVYAFFEKDDKWGCIDLKGKERIKPEYSYLIGMMESYKYELPIYHKYCVAIKDEKQGLITWEGEVIIPFEYPQIDYREYAFNEKKQFYTDSIYTFHSFDGYDKTVHLNLQLDTVEYHYGGKQKKGWKKLDKLPGYDHSSFRERNPYGQAIYSLGYPDYKSGLYSIHQEKLIIDFTFSSLKAMRHYPYLIAKNDQKLIGLVDTLGNILLPFEFTNIEEGLHCFYVHKRVKQEDGSMKKRMAIYSDSFEQLTDFEYNGVSIDRKDPNHIVIKNGRMGVIDTKLKTIIPIEHNKILAISEADPEKNHYLLIDEDDNLRIVNSKNIPVTDSVYHNINPQRIHQFESVKNPDIPNTDCPCSYHYVFRNWSVGIVDENYQETVPVIYKDMEKASSIYPIVHVKAGNIWGPDYWGVINALTGEVIIPAEYEYKIQTNDKYMIEHKGDSRIIYTRQGEELMRFEFHNYTSVSPVYLGLLQVHFGSGDSYHYDGYGNHVHF